MKSDITLFINSDEMYCAACSKTISNLVKNYLNENNFIFDGISTNFQEKTVEIMGVFVHNKEVAKKLAEQLETAVSEFYRVVGYNIMIDGETIAQDATNPQIKKTKPSYLTLMLQSILPLTAGSSLMVLEHLHRLPSPRPSPSEAGLAINLSIGIASTLFTAYLGYPYFKNALRRAGAMDTLISLGCITALAYSFAVIAYPSYFGDDNASTTFSIPLVVLSLLKLSHLFRDSLYSSINQQIHFVKKNKELPRTVKTYRLSSDEDFLLENMNKNKDTRIEEAKVSTIKIDSIIIVDPDCVVPIDSILLNEEERTVVQERLFGQLGDTIKTKENIIYASSINKNAYPLILRTICPFENSEIKKAEINIQKTPPQPAIEWIGRYFLGIVLTTAVTSSLLWALVGPEPRIQHALQTCIAVLLSACPCGLGLMDTIPSMVKALAFSQGIFIKNDVALFLSTKKLWVFFDKCGTLTDKRLEFTDIIRGEMSSDNVLLMNYGIYFQQQTEEKKRSPIGKALLEKKSLLSENMECSSFEDNPDNPGRGGKAIINGKTIVMGNPDLLKHYDIAISDEWKSKESAYASHAVPVYLSIDGKIEGIFLFQTNPKYQQVLRPDVKESIDWLISHGIKVGIITGDTFENAEQLLRDGGIDTENVQIYARKTPAQKIEIINECKESGFKVGLVGDEINDQGAIQTANYGFSISPAAPASLVADVIFNEKVADLIKLIMLAKIYQQSYYTGLLLVLGLTCVSLLLASGILYPLTHKPLDPMITMMGMISPSVLLMMSIAFFQQLGKTQCDNLFKPASSFCSFPSFFPLGKNKKQAQNSLNTNLLDRPIHKQIENAIIEKRRNSDAGSVEGRDARF